jgi:hypothetical protein
MNVIARAFLRNRIPELWSKLRQRLPHPSPDPSDIEPEGDYDPSNDTFYCLFLKDGTSRSGYLPEKETVMGDTEPH